MTKHSLITPDDHLNEALYLKVSECLSLAKHHYGIDFDYSQIRIDIKGRAAGQLRYIARNKKYSLPELRFNPILLNKYGKVFIDEVVPHECAHLVVYKLFGFGNRSSARVKPHGVEWKSVMTELYGLKPTVTHNFEVERKPRDTYLYECKCVGKIHQLTIIRHNKIQKNRVKYICKGCSKGLNYMRQKAVEN